MSERQEPTPLPRLDRGDLAVLGGILLLGALVRFFYVRLTGLAAFDPWRHLQLVDNLRSGAGFTLFDGQPYLWYSPVWYRLVAALPAAIGPDAAAAGFSLLSAAAIYLLLRITVPDVRRLAASCAGLLVALCGPLVAYTCHYGPEGLALFLTLGGLAVCAVGRGPLTAALTGSAYGLALVLRTNFAFDALLFLPLLRGGPRLVAFAAGVALPLGATWWRNHRIIAGHEFLFTWDGLATPAAGFSPLSTLIVQLHPAVQEGLRRLHEAIIPTPEWLARPDYMVLMVAGLTAVVLCRRPVLLASAALTLLYFLLLDGTLSAHFFRIYLPLFPVLFLAIGQLAPRRPRLAVGLAALVLLAGTPSLVPPRPVSLDVVTPPPELLQEDRYMVNSGFYQPESLIRRFPDKRFIGMPLDVAGFERLRERYPDYAILWRQEFSIQEEIADHLRDSGRYEIVRSGRNVAGNRYTVWRPK